MKRAWIAALVAGLAGCAAPAAQTDREQTMSPPGTSAKECPAMTLKHKSPAPAKLAAACKVTLSQAVETAVKKVTGQALNAVIELEDGKATIEVTIFSNGKVYEVEIDATTGAVLEVEQEDDDDDGDDDDGDGD